MDRCEGREALVRGLTVDTTEQPSGIPLIRTLDAARLLALQRAPGRAKGGDSKQRKKAWRTANVLGSLIVEEITAEAARRGCVEGLDRQLMEARIKGEVWPDFERVREVG